MKSVHDVALADHLWELYGRMADEMGSDRESLVNEAMHVFARLNGYLLPAGLPQPVAEARRSEARPEEARREEARREEAPRDGARRDEAEAGAAPAEPREAGDPQRAVAEQVLETAARLEREVRAREAPPPIPSGPIDVRMHDLVLVREDGTELPVRAERFVIGRGRHCDLVIDNGKVSREHAAILRDALGWELQDLQSANGTWHRRVRVDRRRIEDGDEFFICAERIRCVLR